MILTIIFAIMAVVMIMLIVVIAKLLKQDDFEANDIIATYEAGDGMAPSRMARAGENFVMVYEDTDKTRYGMGIGESLEQLKLVHDASAGRVCDIAGEENHVVWSELSDGRLNVKLYDIAKNELYMLCENQDPAKVPDAVGLFGACAYFARKNDDNGRVAIVCHNIEDDMELEIETAPGTERNPKPIRNFNIGDSIMNIIEQEEDEEINLVAISLETRVKSSEPVGVRAADETNYAISFDSVNQIVPNFAKMTYVVLAAKGSHRGIYEISKDKAKERAVIDGEVLDNSLKCFEGVVYWIERSKISGKPTLNGYNTRARQHIIKIEGVTSYTISGSDLYYFCYREADDVKALARRQASGATQSSGIAELKAEIKAEKKATKEARKSKKK